MPRSARDIEDILPAIDNLGKAEEYLTVPLTMDGVEWRDGNFGEYAIVHATLGNGDEVAFSIGSQVASRQLKSLEAANAFPVSAALVEKLNVKSGRKFMEFISPSKLEAMAKEA